MLIFRTGNLQRDGLAIDGPRTADRAGDALGKRVADEPLRAQVIDSFMSPTVPRQLPTIFAA